MCLWARGGLAFSLSCAKNTALCGAKLQKLSNISLVTDFSGEFWPGGERPA
jgi:hypothetical protein